MHGPDGATEAEMSNHLVLTVHDLPTDADPEGAWYVDVGLGDALHEPLPLRAGRYDQGPFHLELEATPGGVGDWHLVHDPEGSFRGMAWRSEPTGIEAFADRNVWLSTSPDSGFVKFLVVQRRERDGCRHLARPHVHAVGAGATESTIANEAELFDVLGDRFGLDLTRVANDDRTACGRNRVRPTRRGRPRAGPSCTRPSGW